MEGLNVTETQPLKHNKILNSLNSRKEALDNSDGLFANIDIKSFLVACLANLYEYYDFALLGFFAEEVGNALFPHGSDVTYAIEVYTLYAVGFLFRPLGGAFFGYMGDKIGRKNALRMAMIMMAFPTFLTGCLPTYNMIGWWSPALLLFFRIMQGLSTGGENCNVATYIYEIADKNKRAFFMSLLGVSASGTLVASIFHVILSSSMSNNDLKSYGWRIPFWFGIGLIFVVLWGKSNMKESETFKDMRTHEKVKTNPLSYSCKYHFDILIEFMFVSSIQHATAYAVSVFVPSYLNSESMHGWNDEYAYGINAINSIIAIPLVLIIGYFTDLSKYKAITFLYPGCILSFLFSPILFYLFSTTVQGTQGVLLDWLYQFILTIMYSLIHGCIYYWYISKLLIDPRTRVTLFGIGYNLGAALFGGTASLIGSGFVAVEGSAIGMLLLGCWISFLSLIAFCIIFYVERKRANSKLNNNEDMDTSYLSGLPFGVLPRHNTRGEFIDITEEEEEQQQVNGNSNEYDPILTDKE